MDTTSTIRIVYFVVSGRKSSFNLQFTGIALVPFQHPFTFSNGYSYLFIRHFLIFFHSKKTFPSSNSRTELATAMSSNSVLLYILFKQGSKSGDGELIFSGVDETTRQGRGKGIRYTSGMGLTQHGGMGTERGYQAQQQHRTQYVYIIPHPRPGRDMSN
jgi:hypothetical protein